MKKSIILLMSVLIFSAFASCSPAEPMGEAFLQQYYKYDVSAAERWAGDNAATAKIMSEKVEKYLTPEEFHVLLVDDWWEAFQTLAGPKKINCNANDIVLEKQEDGSFSYKLTVKMSDELGTQLGEVEQNGTLSFGKDGKISDFSPANLEELIAFFHLPAQRSK